MTTGVRIFEKETLIPASPGHRNLIEHFKNAFEFKDAAALPVRFAISRLDDVHYQCELGVLEGIQNLPYSAVQLLDDVTIGTIG